MAVELVLYQHGDTDVKFEDGSRLELSSCGGEFAVFGTPPVDTKSTFDGGRFTNRETNNECFMCLDFSRVIQRSQFVTTFYKERLQEATEFRNRFCEQPMLCPSLIDKRRVMVLWCFIIGLSSQKDALFRSYCMTTMKSRGPKSHVWFLLTMAASVWYQPTISPL